MLTLEVALLTLWLARMGDRLEVPAWPLYAAVALLLLEINGKSLSPVL